MSHTIPLGSPKYDQAVAVCNGDFSGKVSLRAWKSIDDYAANREPDVSVDVPDGLVVPLVRAYLERRIPSLVESWLPKLLDKLVR